MIVTLRYALTTHTWVAEILGLSRRYGLDRDFIAAFSSDRKRCTKDYILVEDWSLYELCECGKRSFVQASVHGLEVLSKEGLMAELLRAEDRARKAEQEVDDRIARFNAEGGFTTN